MNPRLLVLALGVGIGYVLGTRDGRARYDQMKAKVTELWEDPRVVKARNDVEAYARQQAPVIRERAEAAAKAAPGVAKDVASKVADTAKDVSAKASATAKDVAAKATETAKDVRAKAGEVAHDLRERGESAVDSAVEAAGRAREAVLDTIDDEGDTPKS
jgi:hypothetical protein